MPAPWDPEALLLYAVIGAAAGAGTYLVGKWIEAQSEELRVLPEPEGIPTVRERQLPPLPPLPPLPRLARDNNGDLVLRLPRIPTRKASNGNGAVGG